MDTTVHANIYNFFGITQEIDDDGDQLNGIYFQLCSDDNMPLSHLMGPYHDNEQAEVAARHAAKTHDY